MKKRYINTKFWSDSYIDNLDPTEKLLFLYFLTNERTNIAGVYELPLKIMAVETGIDKSMIEKILRRFEDDEKVWYIEGWVWIKNHIKHQNLNNSKITRGIELCIAEIPPKILKQILVIDELWISHTSLIDLDSDLDLDSDSDLNQKVFANAKTPISDISYEKVTKQEYKSKKQIATKKGIKLKRTPRTSRQEETTAALKMVDYYRDRAQELHGMQFFKVKDESRNKAVRKLIIRASKECDLKDLIDWWLDGAGEWAEYEPEPCFSTKTIERFLNKNNRKQPKMYTFKKDGTIIIS